MILIAILPLTIFAQKNSTLPEAGSVADSLFLTIPPSKQLQKLPLPAASLQAAPEAIIIEGPFCDDKMDIPPHNFLPANANWVSFWVRSNSRQDDTGSLVEYRLITTRYANAWHILLQNREIIFHELDAGKYSLEVRRKKNSSTDKYDTAIVNFEVDRKWYKKTGWQILFFIVLALLFYVFTKLYLSKLLENKKELEKKVSERTIQLQNNNKELEKKIVELDKVTKNLRETNRLREQLVNILSHDVHSPLRFSTMVGKAVLTKHHDLNKEEIIDALTDINQTGIRVLLLISNILKWVEYQKENYTPRFTNENLHQMVQDKIEFFRFMANHKNIELINNIPTSINITTDKTAFGVIIQNLLNNAVKFTPDGEIEVNAVSQNKSIILTIIDTGSGFPQKSIDAIKQGQMILPLADTDNLKGNGLGWILIKDLLYHLNFKFEIKSSEGAGTRVSLIIPV